MGKRYRIVRDGYCGYEAQSWRWWFPFWVQMGGTNTHCSLGDAEAFVDRRRNKVVKYL